MIDLRKQFVDTLIELAEQDGAICMITCDVGFSFLERFKEKFPDRYFNFGTTEFSSMIIASGLALQGMKPYIYSMTNFVTIRPLEMVRNAICLHRANVKILGVRGSEKYKFLGFSHNMIFEDEDVYHLKPYMECYLPKTEDEVRDIIKKTYSSPNSCYIRL